VGELKKRRTQVPDLGSVDERKRREGRLRLRWGLEVDEGVALYTLFWRSCSTYLDVVVPSCWPGLDPRSWTLVVLPAPAIPCPAQYRKPTLPWQNVHRRRSTLPESITPSVRVRSQCASESCSAAPVCGDEEADAVGEAAICDAGPPICHRVRAQIACSAKCVRCAVETDTPENNHNLLDLYPSLGMAHRLRRHLPHCASARRCRRLFDVRCPPLAGTYLSDLATGILQPTTRRDPRNVRMHSELL
jgi:hypothetical protein